ncbi:MAG: DUF6562 domain-containing protein [Candidatus Limisoma sp.]
MRKLLLLISLLSLFCLSSCDDTIHFYPKSEPGLVILQLNVDRNPTSLYKAIYYDKDWNQTTELISGSDSPYEYPGNYMLRITVEIYKNYGEYSRADNPGIDSSPVERRVLLLPPDAQMPQDTIHAYLPDGKFKVLAFADYVPAESPSDWHYLTTNLTDITTNLESYPRNPHLRSAAAGSASFVMTRQLLEGCYPATEEDLQTPVLDRVISINLVRTHGRIRVYSTDWRQAYESQNNVSIKFTYKDYVSCGYSVWTQEPSDYVTSYSYITKPPLGDIDPVTDSRLMVEDYIFAPSSREMILHAMMVSYDRYGNVIKTNPDIVIPVRRNQTTIIYTPNFTVDRDDVNEGSSIGVDEGFDDEIVVNF